ncbi:MAG: 30S ribosomal protein S5 alanine N-acetyltransferase [Candidatus Micrarchaeota archaeon]|nr:MAG: 30S ribosomal protein S5 alanine N-acetyltransferase [Candidatus Micrarchaeota archaeon]
MIIDSSRSRVMLRSLDNKDALRISELGNDKEIYRNEGLRFPHPYDINTAIDFIFFSEISESENRSYNLAIIKKDENLLIGIASIYNIDNVNRKAEIGYWIGRSYWGKGYGSEAAELCVAYAFYYMKMHKIYAEILEYNDRSKRLLERLNFKNTGRFRSDIKKGFRYYDVLYYELLRNEYNNKIGRLKVYR